MEDKELYKLVKQIQQDKLLQQFKKYMENEEIKKVLEESFRLDLIGIPHSLYITEDKIEIVYT